MRFHPSGLLLDKVFNFTQNKFKRVSRHPQPFLERGFVPVLVSVCPPISVYVKKVRTNMGKQAIGYAVCVIWDEIPLKLKELSVYQFSKQQKPYLLSEQHS